jgi:iron complex transport system ATP-binding protein
MNDPQDGLAVSTPPTHLRASGLSLVAGGLRGGRVLFDGLSFEVRSGERWVVLGPNGAGKSSLLAALAGVFERRAGTLELDRRPMEAWSLAARADRRAWCPQFWSDPFPASVIETVRLARDRAGSSDGSTEGDAALEATLRRLDLLEFAPVDVRTLSGGERQRVAIATTLLQGAPLLLLDEPASHLDLAHQRVLLALLRAHASEGGAIVASLHDLNLAWELATHVVLLDGRGDASAGPRDERMTAQRLGAVFGVSLTSVDVDDTRRFWPAASVELAP